MDMKKTHLNFLQSLLYITLLSSVLSGCKWWDDSADQSKPDYISDFQNRDSIDYEVSFSETDIDSNIISQLSEISALIKLQNRPLPTLNALKNRSKRDVEQFKNYLISLGYCSAKASFSITENKDEEDTYKVFIKLDPGPQFQIQKVDFKVSGIENDFLKNQNVTTEDLLNIKIESTLNFSAVQAAVVRLESYFKERGYPFVLIEKPEIILHNSKILADIVFKIKTGPKCKFGETHITGLVDLDESFVRNRLQWQAGQIYNVKVVEKTRKQLIETGLLGSIQFEPEQPVIQNTTNIRSTVSQSPARRLGAGIRYATSQGVGGRIYWDHYNMLGHGEHLHTSLSCEKMQTQAKLGYDVPDFLAPQQSLLNEVSFTYDKKRAYYGRTLHGGSLVQKKINDHISAGLGLSAEKSKLKQTAFPTSPFQSSLWGLPIDFKWDATEDLLNPTQGMRLFTRITPYSGRIGHKKPNFSNINLKQRSFAISDTKVSAYLPVLKNTLGEEKLIIAGFVRAGTIFGKNLTMSNGRINIPPNKSFYAGGADSIRAYGYQLLGPLDNNRNPLGGLSYNEYGVEVRVKTTEKTGFVIFTEAGAVSGNKSPNFKSKDRLWGSGIGFRYYSALAPIRVDIAFPHKVRRNINGKRIDAPFQIYLSVGQAF